MGCTMPVGYCCVGLMRVAVNDTVAKSTRRRGLEASAAAFHSGYHLARGGDLPDPRSSGTSVRHQSAQPSANHRYHIFVRMGELGVFICHRGSVECWLGHQGPPQPPLDRTSPADGGQARKHSKPLPSGQRWSTADNASAPAGSFCRVRGHDDPSIKQEEYNTPARSVTHICVHYLRRTTRLQNRAMVCRAVVRSDLEVWIGIV